MVGRKEALDRFPSIEPHVWTEADAQFPVRLPRGWMEQVEHPDDPMGLQALPGPGELADAPGDLLDPVGEDGRSPLPWIVRKHADRVLLLVTRRCHMYCRYCFRRNHTGPDDPDDAALAESLAYIRTSGARELILSGGDPLAVTDARLAHILDAVQDSIPIIRIHTRAPITAPQRVTEALVSMLRQRAPVWVIVHCNHPRELSASVLTALGRLVDAGIPVLNQAVLLRGVNDNVDTLAALCEQLVAARVFPYYLHHTDAAAGNNRFRVGVEEGLAIYDALSRRVSGVALPQYVIDPPDGSGKIPVSEWARRSRPGR
ncbi:MAG: KamA family radical SAM protein [Myxococcota bacterium]|nr:KamA family radical SAM protein [Myxococcota bacterium]